MGERWSFMILRASFNGLHHFEEFLTELGIARNILSNRLAKLVENGILKRDPCAEDKRKIEYRLTDKGLDLLPAMVALRQWGQKYGAEVVENPVLVDEPRPSADRADLDPQPRWTDPRASRTPPRDRLGQDVGAGRQQGGSGACVNPLAYGEVVDIDSA